MGGQRGRQKGQVMPLINLLKFSWAHKMRQHKDQEKFEVLKGSFRFDPNTLKDVRLIRYPDRKTALDISITDIREHIFPYKTLSVKEIETLIRFIEPNWVSAISAGKSGSKPAVTFEIDPPFVQTPLEQSQQIGENVGSGVKFEPIIVCPICKGQETIKRGSRKTAFGVNQRYGCKSCGSRFTANENGIKVESRGEAGVKLEDDVKVKPKGGLEVKFKGEVKAGPAKDPGIQEPKGGGLEYIPKINMFCGVTIYPDLSALIVKLCGHIEKLNLRVVDLVIELHRMNAVYEKSIYGLKPAGASPCPVNYQGADPEVVTEEMMEGVITGGISDNANGKKDN